MTAAPVWITGLSWWRIAAHSGSRQGPAQAPAGGACPRSAAGRAALHPCTLSAEGPGARSSGLVQRHIVDLSTSNSAPGEEGSKPCSISQRAATRLRHDHHARITSRSTSVP